MARRTTDAEASPEADASTDTTTAPVTETPAAAPEAPIDLTAFEAAVQAAIDSSDKATGEIAEASVEPVKAAYLALDGRPAKNKAKAVLQDGVRAGMTASNIQLARGYMQLTDAMAGARVPSAKTEKAPVDPTQHYVDTLSALYLAPQLVVVPEGVDATVAYNTATEFVSANLASAQTYLAWLTADPESRGDEPETAPVVKAAVKLSQGKAAKVSAKAGTGVAFDGPRRNVAAHIANAFSDKPSGTFLTIAEIRSTKSAEYGDDLPSAGAISARLFPSSGKCSVEGVTPNTNAQGNKGATKV